MKKIKRTVKDSEVKKIINDVLKTGKSRRISKSKSRLKTGKQLIDRLAKYENTLMHFRICLEPGFATNVNDDRKFRHMTNKILSELLIEEFGSAPVIHNPVARGVHFEFSGHSDSYISIIFDKKEKEYEITGACVRYMFPIIDRIVEKIQKKLSTRIKSKSFSPLYKWR